MAHSTTVTVTGMRSGRGRFPAPGFGADHLRTLVCVALATLVALGAAGCRKKTPDERLQEIQDLFQQRKLVPAVLKAKELIRDNPQDPAAYDARMVLAFYYFQTGDPERTHQYLEETYKGLGLGDMRGFQALMQDLGIYQMQEDFKGGLERVEWALNTVPHDSPTSAELVLAKASLLVSSKEPAEGEKLLQYSMLHAPTKPQRDQAREMLAQHYRTEKQWHKVVDVYDEFEKAFPDTDLKPHFDIARGMARIDMGQKDEGTKQFSDGIDALSKQAQAELEKNKAAELRLTIAKYYAVAKMPEKAEETLRTVRKEYPKTTQATEAGVMIGDLLAQQKKFPEAIEAYEQLRDENPLGQIAQELAQRIQRVKRLQEQDRETTGSLTGAETTTSPTQAQDQSPPGS